MTESLQNGDLNFLYVEALVQKEAGADLVDINVCTVGVNEAEAMRDAVGLIQSMVPVPMQLSSQNCEALEAGARVINGKPLMNSVDGTKQSMDQILPIAAKYGACLIGKTSDDNGVPESPEERLATAERILEAALSHGIRKQDLIIDCMAESAALRLGLAETTLRTFR